MDMRFVIVTGMSGAGKSSVLKMLEVAIIPTNRITMAIITTATIEQEHLLINIHCNVYNQLMPRHHTL